MGILQLTVDLQADDKMVALVGAIMLQKQGREAIDAAMDAMEQKG